jgi:hypothetical protein
VSPLVSLKLDHLAVLGVVHHCTIASKLLWITVCVRVYIYNIIQSQKEKIIQ